MTPDQFNKIVSMATVAASQEQRHKDGSRLVYMIDGDVDIDARKEFARVVIREFQLLRTEMEVAS